MTLVLVAVFRSEGNSRLRIFAAAANFRSRDLTIFEKWVGTTSHDLLSTSVRRENSRPRNGFAAAKTVDGCKNSRLRKVKSLAAVEDFAML